MFATSATSIAAWVTRRALIPCIIVSALIAGTGMTVLERVDRLPGFSKNLIMQKMPGKTIIKREAYRVMLA